MTYATADHQWKNTSRRKLENNTYLERNDDGSYGVRLHATQVVTFYPNGDVSLDSGGWKTVTTKTRMNSYALGCQVYQDRGVWWVRFGGKLYPYADGMILRADGTVTGSGGPGVSPARWWRGRRSRSTS